MASKAAMDLLGQDLPVGTAIDQQAQHYGLFRADGQLYAPADLPLSRALRGETVVGQEVVIRRPDGVEVSVLVNGAPLRFGSTIVGAVAVFQDITALKEAQWRIQELSRQREEFISVVAHDLKGALTAIHGYAELLIRPDHRKALSPVAQQAVETIAQGTRRLERMINDLLDVSRLEARRLSLEKQPLDLVALVRDVVARTVELTKGHTVELEVRGNIPRLEADPVRIEQILTNLLSNAGKYAYPNTPIILSVEPVDGEVLVSVSNEGPGIEPEDIPKLFTRFHRTEAAKQEKTPGLGLGLYISKGLVEAHGGRMWVESQPGKITTFRFTLPEMAA